MLTPPKGLQHPFISCRRKLMKLNIPAPNIDISSINTTFRWKYLHLMELSWCMSSGLKANPRPTGVPKAEWIELPPMLCAALPVGAHNKILILSGFSPNLILRTWSELDIKIGEEHFFLHLLHLFGMYIRVYHSFWNDGGCCRRISFLFHWDFVSLICSHHQSFHLMEIVHFQCFFEQCPNLA